MIITDEYLACMFDCEGSICLALRGGSALKHPCVVIYNLHKPILLAIKDRFEGRVHWSNGCFIWQRQGGQLTLFLETILPYTLARTEEVQAALEICRATKPPGTRYTDKEYVLRDRLEKRFYQAAEARKQLLESFKLEGANESTNASGHDESPILGGSTP